MARYWVLMTMAAILILSGLTSMSEDRSPEAVSPVSAASPGPRMDDAASARAQPPGGGDLTDRASRRSYERRNQRNSSTDAAVTAPPVAPAHPLMTGSIRLARMVTEVRAHPMLAHLGPAAPVSAPTSAADPMDTPMPPPAASGPPARLAAPHARLPVPRRAKTAAQGAPRVMASLAPETRTDALSLADTTSANQILAQPPARILVRRPSHRQVMHGVTSGQKAASARRAVPRRLVRYESLWPRNQRDGS